MIMMQDLDAAILTARMDPATQVIVLTGDGEKLFCAGANIAMLRDATSGFKRELQQLLFQSEDAREGVRANLEKRPPVFKGR